ncbi:transcription termination factor 4, mitochondrial [Drosophila kikkawai]|uniref:Transcription termination factor 4, mitochondrial n=1 Tax=Drosophila kikkawai TaxID=30033 RepID=A0A6P4J2F8_DROKI|nr:uncharacterized protein LOC108079633 [Drosophila kikkawai]
MIRKLVFNAKVVLKQQPKFQLVKHLATNSESPKIVQLQQIHIDEAVKLEPNLSIFTSEVWRRAHETFQNHGLETGNFLRIVTGNPGVLRRTPDKIINSLEIWRACQFGENLLHLLLTKYPELLDVSDSHQLLSHIGFLKSRVSTSKNVWKLLMNSPDVIAQPEEVVEEKLNLMVDVMRLEVPEIVKSCALTLPFEELRCRHAFLLRLGLFKPRPLKADPDEPTTNPKLYQITDTSEKTFATKICHVTLPEFEAFKELYAKELEGKSRRSKEAEDLSDDED